MAGPLAAVRVRTQPGRACVPASAFERVRTPCSSRRFPPMFPALLALVVVPVAVPLALRGARPAAVPGAVPAAVLQGPVYAELRDARWRAVSKADAGVGAAEATACRLDPQPGHPDTRTTEVERGAHAFRDLLVSWNVDVPAHTAIVVELRVQRDVDSGIDGAWSPWMHLGDWGESALVPPLDARVTTCAGGRVDIDYFRGDELFVGAELRVRASTDAADAGSVDVRRLRLCFSDRKRSVSPVAASDPRPLGVVLDVTPRRQGVEAPAITARICSPTSVAMVLDWRGIHASTAEVAARAFDAAHDLYGNWPRNVQAAYSLGVPGYLTRYSDWAAVERTIAEKTPIVISIAVESGELQGAPYESTAGHLIVLVGFDAAGDCVVNDPAVHEADRVRRTYRRADLERVWMARGGTAYVLEARQ